MPRFFVSKDAVNGDSIVIDSSDAHHISSVLRMKEGDKLTVCDFFGKEYLCTITRAQNDKVFLHILEERMTESEPPCKIVLLMALPKGDKMEWIIQKAVELGIHEIVPFSSKYTIVKLDEKSAQKKVERWQKIAKSAAEQSGRGIIPQICLPVPFDRALEMHYDASLKILCYEGEEERRLKDACASVSSPEKIVIVVGAEGGFDRNEAIKAENAGFLPVTLGKRILRCETAPLCVLAQLAYAYNL